MPGLGCAVVALHVLSRPRDRQHVEQLEIVEAQHVHQARRAPFGFRQVEPAIELRLGLADRRLDAGDAMPDQRQIIAFGHEGDLVFEVGEPVIDRRRGQHQYLGFHARLDDPLHQVVVAGVAVLMRRLVSEVVGLVDDDEIVVSPIDVGEIDIAGQAAIARQIGVIQNVVVEAIAGKDVAAVIGLVERPVVPEALRAQHQHAIIAKLVIFDDGQRLERFSETDAIGDDAAADTFKLVDGADNAVALEAEQLLPDDRVSYTGGGLDDPLFIKLVAQILEQLIQDLEIDEATARAGSLPRRARRQACSLPPNPP